MRSCLIGVMGALVFVADAYSTGRRLVESTTHFRIESAIEGVDPGHLPRLLEAQSAALAKEFEAEAPRDRLMILHASIADLVDAVVDSMPLKSPAEKAFGLAFFKAALSDNRGLFFEDTGVAHVVWQGSPDRLSYLAALHEAVHQFMHLAGVQKERTKSRAYQEGMAERWSNYCMEAEVIEFGPALAPRVSSIVRAYTEANVRNFDLGEIAAKERCPASLAWAFVTFLSEAESQRFAAWARDVATPDDLAASWARHFPQQAELNVRFRNWLTGLYASQPFRFVTCEWSVASDRQISAAVHAPLLFEAVLKRPMRSVRIVSNVATTAGAIGVLADYADDQNYTMMWIRPHIGSALPPEVGVRQFRAGASKAVEHLPPMRVADVNDVRIDFVPAADGCLAVAIDGQTLTTLPSPATNAFGVLAGSVDAEFSITYADEWPRGGHHRPREHQTGQL